MKGKVDENRTFLSPNNVHVVIHYLCQPCSGDTLSLQYELSSHLLSSSGFNIPQTGPLSSTSDSNALMYSLP
jgi:hypothetical protein